MGSEDEVDPEGANAPEFSPLFFSWDSAPRPPEEEEGGGERSSADEGVAETSSHAWLVLADVRDRVWEDEMGAEEELVCMEGGRGSVEVVGSYAACICQLAAPLQYIASLAPARSRYE